MTACPRSCEECDKSDHQTTAILNLSTTHRLHNATFGICGEKWGRCGERSGGLKNSAHQPVGSENRSNRKVIAFTPKTSPR